MGNPNGILVIDKPSGWTSHDVVAKLRGILSERRIGHGGTLDPMATGVLLCFVGRATRAVSFVSGEKTYLASFQTGYTTDTLDCTGTVRERFDAVPSEAELRAAASRFTGDIEQIPPMVSAIKRDGQPLYKLARQGIDVEREPRRVRICAIEWLGALDGHWRMRVFCSAGTYIRTLVDDIGRLLGCGACLTALRREASGPFSERDALSLSEAGRERLLPVDAAFPDLPLVSISGDQAFPFGNGLAVSVSHEDAELVRVYAPDGAFRALGRVRQGLLHPVKSFIEVNA